MWSNSTRHPCQHLTHELIRNCIQILHISMGQQIFPANIQSSFFILQPLLSANSPWIPSRRTGYPWRACRTFWSTRATQSSTPPFQIPSAWTALPLYPLQTPPPGAAPTPTPWTSTTMFRLAFQIPVHSRHVCFVGFLPAWASLGAANYNLETWITTTFFKLDTNDPIDWSLVTASQWLPCTIHGCIKKQEIN